MGVFYFIVNYEEFPVKLVETLENSVKLREALEKFIEMAGYSDKLRETLHKYQTSNNFFLWLLFEMLSWLQRISL